MKFYSIDTLADYGQEGWCYTNNEPEGIGYQTYRLAEGIELREYPADKKDVTLSLDQDHQGIRKGSFIGNSSGMLIMDRQAKEVVEEFVKEHISYYQFTLLDHKGRVHSEDYFIVNPLGAQDYLNIEKSEIDYDEDGKIHIIRETVLDEKKLQHAPHLFRVEPITDEYYISQELKDALEAAGVTNLNITEVAIG